MYWNKAAFKEAGLDPNRPPANWDELVEYGKKLTVKDASGKVTRWGLIIPSGVTSHWFLQGFTTQNRAKLTNDAGTETYLATPEAIEALQFWVDLSRKHQVMQAGIIDTGAAPNEFIDGRAAIMFHSTGNLTNVKNNAKFDFGVAMLPARKQRGSATGGGSIYIFKKSTPEQLDASYQVRQVDDERRAGGALEHRHRLRRRRQDAWDLPVMKKYAQDFPAAAVALQQLPFCAPEFSTHDGPRTTKALEDAIDASITGTKAPGEGAGRRAGGGDAHPAPLQALSRSRTHPRAIACRESAPETTTWSRRGWAGHCSCPPPRSCRSSPTTRRSRRSSRACSPTPRPGGLRASSGSTTTAR